MHKMTSTCPGARPTSAMHSGCPDRTVLWRKCQKAGDRAIIPLTRQFKKHEEVDITSGRRSEGSLCRNSKSLEWYAHFETAKSLFDLVTGVLATPTVAAVTAVIAAGFKVCLLCGSYWPLWLFFPNPLEDCFGLINTERGKTRKTNSVLCGHNIIKT